MVLLNEESLACRQIHFLLRNDVGRTLVHHLVGVDHQASLARPHKVFLHEATIKGFVGTMAGLDDQALTQLP